ncbi:MAG TPA: GAF domain-containing protein [Pyrinomonadaceae bacterium]|nr:GAF domain-containing protein [Pyrinomonadaceae bacterium]
MSSELNFDTTPRIVSLVLDALNQEELSGISVMLRSIAESLNASGCILWRKEDISKRYLFIAAQWFPQQRCDLRRLPLGQSRTGEAVRHRKTIIVSDVDADEGVYQDSFLKEANVKTICIVPITYEDGRRGALNLYRTFPTPFDSATETEAKQLASVVPALYRTISDKVSLRLIDKVNGILHDAEVRSPDHPLSKAKVKEVLARIARLVANSLQCVETSIFLEDRLERPGSFELMATTWKGHFDKPVYRADVSEGLTGWVLKHAASVGIFDLAHFTRDREAIQRKYKGITWKNSLNFDRTVRRRFATEFRRSDLPPLSFMAAPIVKGTVVRGAIRCCVTNKGPFYFSDADMKLLQLVASQIARAWSNWLYRREIQEENASWKSLVGSIGMLNNFVHNELKQKQPNEQQIFKEALRVTSSVISGAEIMDVRLFDPETNTLFFASTHGDAWTHGDRAKIEERLRRRFQVRDWPNDQQYDPKQESAGAWVFRTGQIRRISDVTTDPNYSATFPNTKHMLIAPISVEEDKYGVLDIRSTGDRDFPNHSDDIALLLGQQLGLYKYLAQHVGTINRLERERLQTYQDMEHQLSHPVILAHGRVQSLLRNLPDEEARKANLLPIRGLCRKAMQVTLSTWIFVSLSQNKPIKPTKLVRLRPQELVKKLIEAAIDNTQLLDPARNIRFEVDRKTFDVLKTEHVEADYDLLDQAISNILDNAGKYSFDNTVVRIYGGLTSTRRFHISAANKGVPIRHNEVRKVVEREWRGEQAQWVTSEGSGIGLYIVDNIMKACGGELIVTPTTDKITDIKLVLPVLKP